MVVPGCHHEATRSPRCTPWILSGQHRSSLDAPRLGLAPTVHTGGALELAYMGSTVVQFHTVASFFLSLVYGNIWRVFIYLILYSVITIVGLANIQQV